MKRSYYIINGITIYRVIAAPFLIILIMNGHVHIFKWMLAISFFTDAIDGFLARRYKVTSILGAKLDSIGDDLTVLVGIAGIFIHDPGFISDQAIPLLVLLGLFIVQVTIALIRYRKTTTYHTYAAKLAAVFQGVFLILFFFLDGPFYPLFWAAWVITAIDLVEEIVLVLILPKWEANVKGIYWLRKAKVGRKV